MWGTINIQVWKDLLSRRLPGEEAQLSMAPSSRRRLDHPVDPVQAAVMVLMYPVNDLVHVVLIKRNEYDGHHSAQVSFPGGSWEESDGDLERTAIREAEEELGISADLVVLGSLSELHIPVSNYLVKPFVAWMGHRPDFKPDPSEVQYIIEVSLNGLLDPSGRGSEKVHLDGIPVEVPFYRVGQEKIWGATAMILSEFLQLASRLQ